MIADEIAPVTLYPERPRMNVDGAILDPIANGHLLVAVVPGKDAHLTIGRRLKAEIEGNPVAQVSDTVDPQKIAVSRASR